MRFTARLTNLGVELSLGDSNDAKPLKAAIDADQKNPRRSYVYAHVDSAGNIFYVGKGEARRAWSTDRHLLWHRYVDKHLAGKYEVRILQDNLSKKRAEEVEAAWIAQCSEGLVNWVNMGRDLDYRALDNYHRLRNANRALIQQAKVIEKADLAQAAKMYIQAIEAIPEYAFISYEKGLVGQLLDEDTDQFGRNGEIEALDRLTMCLTKLGRPAEAAQHADNYFALFRRDLSLSASQRITKRVNKALSRKR